MALFGKRLGARSGEVVRDVKQLYDYIAYLTEQLEYRDGQIRRQMEALGKGAVQDGTET